MGGDAVRTLYQSLHRVSVTAAPLDAGEFCFPQENRCAIGSRRNPGVPRLCRFCQQSFEPSKFRPDQSVCNQPNCRRRRRAEYHRRKIATDPLYAQVVGESRKKWRDAHPDYQKTYRQSHAAAAERNRQLQRGRDAKRRAQFLVKNNLALDLKHCAAEVWLIGRAAGDLERNNLAACKMLIFQPVASVAAAAQSS